MHVADYYEKVFTPAHVAIAAIRRAGIPIDLERVRKFRKDWQKELARLEKYVEGVATEHGLQIKYSEKHGLAPEKIAELIYDKLGFDCYKYTEKAGRSTDDGALAAYASLKVPRPDDDPVCAAILQIRSYQKGIATYLDGFERAYRSDGAIHPKYNWSTVRTARISAEDPPVHGIPERADKKVAEAIKSCIVPRIAPAPSPEAWNPHKHGTCGRWDISGAEAAIRAAMLTHRFLPRPEPIAWDYIRNGKDIHSKTASLIYQVPEGTYTKGSYERDAVGKTTFFAKLFGARWRAVQGQFWEKARLWIPDAEIKTICDNFDKGYVGLVELYEYDQRELGELGYCEDAYGRRRLIDIPRGVRYEGNGKWFVPGKNDKDRSFFQQQLHHAFHIKANTPTQGTNATDNFWMLALCYLGEYVELRVPPMWEAGGIPFSEAKNWRMHEGPGPGGKPLLSWHNNTVHDSGWFDNAPGHLEPTAKVIWRRCRALPLDWRIEADVPYRIDLSVGPNMNDLRPYNKVAAAFGLEPMPER